MILLAPQLSAMSQSMDTIPDALRIAMRLEFATIPVYLYALYSLDTDDTGKNQAIHDLLRTVVIEEMLHMAQVGNILNALGAPPQLNSPDMVPTFPNPLPGGVEAQLTVGLKPFSLEAVTDTFLVIEEPEHPLDFPIAAAAPPLTIGRFYANINQTIQAADPGIFVGDPPRQVAAQSHGTGIFKVTDKASVAQAIDLIVEQGEGTTSSPNALNGDFAHFYRFQEIKEGRKLIKNPNAVPTDPPDQQFVFSDSAADAIPFDASGVRPLRESPKAADYAPGSPERLACDAFNVTYTKLLKGLHDAFNGQPNKLGATTATMFQLSSKAAELANIRLADGTHAGPSFEFVP